MRAQPDTKLEEGQTGIFAREEAQEEGQNWLRRLWNAPTWLRAPAPPPKSYPPISSIPRTSNERLALASPDVNPADGATAKTVLYLAYGSNLCAETFLGYRGIRPLSQINVSAPAFDLSFDLPGIAYNEPCFANTQPRRIPKPPIPIPGKPPQIPPPPTAPASTTHMAPDNARRPTWSKGLYGVVYEVTPEDYATIIRTEGGGQGYKDVLTPCFELPPALHVPEKPPIPDLPKPFLAHTLFAPRLPDLPKDPEDPGKDDDAARQEEEEEGEDDGGNSPKDPRKLPWFRRLLLPVHRSTNAQASARYLKLIRDGAREHALPDDYQAYLAQLQPYTITRLSQRLGRLVFTLCAFPGFLMMIGLGRLLADKEGRSPRWLGVATTVWMNLLWKAYDVFYKPVFGDGERTMAEEETVMSKMGKMRARRRKSRTAMMVGDVDGIREEEEEEVSEKKRLLGDW
ncbi:hypothetical protein F5Y08DRAFT_293212 [Xylaria arbuscula]|nr:hypothetical protein F5Y08DRAFT_293212 [Xylaria arbuscula]